MSFAYSLSPFESIRMVASASAPALCPEFIIFEDPKLKVLEELWFEYCPLNQTICFALQPVLVLVTLPSFIEILQPSQ